MNPFKKSFFLVLVLHLPSACKLGIWLKFTKNKSIRRELEKAMSIYFHLDL